MLLNCSVGEDSSESLGLQGDQTSQSYRKSILNIHWNIFIGRSSIWPTDAKSWLIGEDPDYGKDWRQEEKKMTKDEMVGWRHRLNGHEFEQAPGVGDGQGSLVCCSPWGRKESDTTEWLNNKETLTEEWLQESWRKASHREVSSNLLSGSPAGERPSVRSEPARATAAVWSLCAPPAHVLKSWPPEMVVLGGAAGGRCLHREGGAWWIGSVPCERDPRGLSPLLPWEDTGRRCPLRTRRGDIAGTRTHWRLHLGLPSLQNWEKEMFVV